MAKRISNNGLALIGRFEGLRLTAYKPVSTERYWTIGYGHYGPDVRPGQRITQARALELLRQDARQAESKVNEVVKVPLSQGQFDALVSFAFNVGNNAFATSTLVKKLNNRQYDQVPVELMKWVRGGGRVLPGLVTRRRAEGQLFIKSGVDPRAEKWRRELKRRRAQLKAQKDLTARAALRKRINKLKRAIKRET